MFYDFAVTVPASTAEASPVTQGMKLTTGIVHRVEVQFPAGCAGLAHCAVEHDGHQFLPTNPDGDFASDDFTVVIDEHYELKKGNTLMRARAWNDDDTYQHTITIRVGIMDSKLWLTLLKVITGLQKMLKLVGVGG